MKLKYYLRGVGIGIIFATLVMALSCVIHNYNLSDEFIIKEAMKLGMVMKDDLNSEDDIWGGNDTQEETEDVAVETEGTEDTQVAGSEVEGSEAVSESESTSESVSESEGHSESQKPEDSQTPVDSQKPEDSQTPVDSQKPEDSQTPGGSQDDAYVTIIIERGDYARQVAEKLYAAGLVADAEEFRVYVGEHGYGKKIHVGTFKIPVGATYEEICKIITS